jgi:hypothetical protein
MTAHAHDPASHADSHRPGSAADVTTTAARPRWLLPGLAAGIIIGALVVGGVLSLSAVLYAGLFGGMLLMHLGGHGGHGGGHGGGHSGGHGGHGGHGSGTLSDGDDLRDSSPAAQVQRPGSRDELDDRAVTIQDGSETQDHDKRGAHGCH